MGIIGNDARIKTILGKFLRSAGRNNWLNFEHIRLRLNPVLQHVLAVQNLLVVLNF